jgi:hypothetical protein
MRVRAICTHYHEHYRKEGQEFPHEGPLYEHIVPVEEELEEKQPQHAKPVKSKGSKPVE